jgi:ribosome-associated toxin RatA of RatAB toxin-antitoxin module
MVPLIPGAGKKSCRTFFDISFEFRSQLHKSMADAYFQEVAQNMIQVFNDRCAHVYRGGKQ